MQQALTIFDPLRMGDFRDAFAVPLFNRRLGELYEAKGDSVNAVKHYRVVTQVWKNADPELQTVVAELRARIRRLSNLERTPR